MTELASGKNIRSLYLQEELSTQRQCPCEFRISFHFFFRSFCSKNSRWYREKRMYIFFCSSEDYWIRKTSSIACCKPPCFVSKYRANNQRDSWQSYYEISIILILCFLIWIWLRAFNPFYLGLSSRKDSFYIFIRKIRLTRVNFINKEKKNKNWNNSFYKGFKLVWFIYTGVSNILGEIGFTWMNILARCFEFSP